MRILPPSVALTFTPRMIVNGWLLTIGALFFLWPVVAGIPSMHARFIWIGIAFLLLLLSTLMLKRGIGRDDVTIRLPRRSLMAALFFPLLLTLYASHFPPLHFSDELTIALGGFTIVERMTDVIPAFLLPLLAVVILALFFFCLTRANLITAVVIVGAMVCCSVAIALLDIQSGLALRYPPLVHAMQIFGGLLTGGSNALFRFPNALWTALLMLVVSTMAREWGRAAQTGIVLGIVAGTLGWTYRIALFQACGELTLALLAAFLLHRTLSKESARTDAGFLGITFALWFLYRPTAIAAVAAGLVVLLLLRRRRELLTTAGVALPVIGAWLLLSPLYTASYGLAEVANPASFPPWLPLITAVRSLPANFGIVGMMVLLGTSLLAFLFGSRPQRVLLGIAWLFGVSTAMLQHQLAGEVFWGVARYNIVLLIAQGVAIGILLHGTRVIATFNKALGIIAVLALLCTTPYDFVLFAQSIRTGNRDIYRTPTEGYLPLPLLKATRLWLKTESSPMILAPDYQFLDLLIAEGKLTRAERDTIVNQSAEWTPADPARPVIIQAPVSTTYTPNKTPVEERRLRDAHAWAIKQPGYIIERLGIEETVVVP